MIKFFQIDLTTIQKFNNFIEIRITMQIIFIVQLVEVYLIQIFRYSQEAHQDHQSTVLGLDRALAASALGGREERLDREE